MTRILKTNVIARREPLTLCQALSEIAWRPRELFEGLCTVPPCHNPWWLDQTA